MIRFKERIRTVLLVVCCFAVCLGVGVIKTDALKTSSVKAATVSRTMTKIAATASSTNTAIYFYAYAGEEAKSTTDWSNQYTFVEGTGDGVKYNGETLVGYDMKQPGNDIYFGLGGKTAVAGDILTLDGTFRNESLDSNIVIDSGALTYNGSSWDRAYYTHDLGEMVLSWPSETEAHARNTQLYITPKNGETVPYPDGTWSTVFTYESGDGLKLNGSSHTIGEMKSVDSGLWFSFDAVEDGDVVSISGTYSCSTEEAKYVLAESKFTWNGTVWENYVPPVVYEEYTLSNLQVADTSMAGGAYCANNVLSLKMDGGATVSDWPWFEYESGAGFKVNGETAELKGNKANAVQDTSGGLYFQFAGVNVDDVVSIGGVFSNADLAIRYVIPETKFTWTGTEWEAIDETVYTEYELGVIEPNTNSSTFGAVSARPDHLYTQGAIALPVQDWDSAFKLESGYGVKVNGEELSSFEMKSTEGGLWFGLSNIKAGDEVSICGTFKNTKHATIYVIEESKMVWNGYTWEKYVEYTTYELGAMRILSDSSTTAAVYVTTVNGEVLPITSWDYRFIFLGDSGIGITLNGEQVVTNDIKSPDGNIYIGLTGKVVEEGAVLKIGGTFRNLDTATAYVITESEFVFVNSVWKSRLDIAKESACAELEEYKTNFVQDDYYDAEWNSFDTIIEEGKASINAAMTSEEIASIVESVKAKMDEVLTKEESDAIFNEASQDAKDDLASYKSESDYREEDWATIQAILERAKNEIDACESVTGISAVVENAKAEMDAVKTSAQRDAEDAVVASAKSDLASYKNQGDYRDAQWTEIQAIITKANGDIDLAIGNKTAIDEIVANAKKEIDKVKTAKTVAKEEVRDYYNAIDHSLYSEEAEESISGYMEEVLAAIDSATTNEELDTAIAEFKSKVEKVEKLEPASGCAGSVGTFGLTAILGLVGVVSVIRRKKEER